MKPIWAEGWSQRTFCWLDVMGLSTSRIWSYLALLKLLGFGLVMPRRRIPLSLTRFSKPETCP